MDYERFKSVVTEVGYTELEAKWLWAGKPKEQEPEEISLMLAAVEMLPSVKILRKNPDHEEKLRQCIAVPNGS